MVCGEGPSRVSDADQRRLIFCGARSGHLKSCGDACAAFVDVPSSEEQSEEQSKTAAQRSPNSANSTQPGLRRVPARVR